MSRARSTAPPAAAALVVMALSAASAEASETVSPLCGSGPLEILVTNDDGWSAPGIRALYTALRAAGHHVKLAAPDRNYSGAGVSMTWTPVTVSRDPADPDRYGLAASPATSALFGITALYPPGDPPDLVISGINDGDNAGALLAISGTVGAALAGTLLVAPPVPAMAVSAQRSEHGGTPGGSMEQHLDAIARHVTSLITATRGWYCDAGGRPRDGAVLNVNYPARPVDRLAGVVAARQSPATDMVLRFVPDGEDRYRSERLPADAHAASDEDLALLSLGYVTVTPIGAAYAQAGPLEDLSKRLRPH